MIRISGWLFLISFLVSVLFISAVGAGRIWQTPQKQIERIEQEHGIRLQKSDTDIVTLQQVSIKESEFPIGGAGVVSLKDITLEGHCLVIGSFLIRTQQEKPWLWLYGFCGKGTQTNILIKSCRLISNDTEIDLGEMTILKKNGILMGKCPSFTLEQASTDRYEVNGDLGHFSEVLHAYKDMGFVQFRIVEPSKENSGVCEMNLEFSNLKTLLLAEVKPFLVNVIWRDQEVRGRYQKDAFGVDLLLNTNGYEMSLYYKDTKVEWKGQIAKNIETYQVILKAQEAFSEVFRSGFYGAEYDLPSELQEQTSGLYEIRRDMLTKRVQILMVSENKMLTLEKREE